MKDYNHKPFEDYKIKEETIVRIGVLKELLFGGAADCFILPTYPKTTEKQKRRFKDKYNIRDLDYTVQYIDKDIEEDLTPKDRAPITVNGHIDVNFDPEDWGLNELEDQGDGALADYFKVGDKIRIGRFYHHHHANYNDNANWFALPLKSATSSSREKRILECYNIRSNSDTISSIKFIKDLKVTERTVLSTNDYSYINFNPEDWKNPRLHSEINLYITIGDKVRFASRKDCSLDDSTRYVIPLVSRTTIAQDIMFSRKYDLLLGIYSVTNIDDEFVITTNDAPLKFDIQDWDKTLADTYEEIKISKYVKIGDSVQVGQLKTDLNKCYYIPVLSGLNEAHVQQLRSAYNISEDMRWIVSKLLDNTDISVVGRPEILHLNPYDWKFEPVFNDLLPIGSEIRILKVKKDCETDTDFNWIGIPVNEPWDESIYTERGIQNLNKGDIAHLTNWHKFVNSRGAISVQAMFSIEIFPIMWKSLREAYPGECPKAILPGKKPESKSSKISDCLPVGTKVRIIKLIEPTDGNNWSAVPKDFLFDKEQYIDMGIHEVSGYNYPDQNWFALDERGSLGIKAGGFYVRFFPKQWNMYKDLDIEIMKTLMPYEPEESKPCVDYVGVNRRPGVLCPDEAEYNRIRTMNPGLTMPTQRDTGGWNTTPPDNSGSMSTEQVDEVMTLINQFDTKLICHKDGIAKMTIPAVDQKAVTDLKEENKMAFAGMNLEKIFGSTIGKDTTDMFKLSMMGIAIKGDNGSYRCYDPEQGSCIDVMEMVIDANNMIFRMPAQTVAAGDLIISNGKPYYVISKIGQNISVFNPIEEKIETIVPSRSMFGWNFFIKVISMFNMMGTTPNTGSLQGMMPMIMMSMFGGSNMFNSKPKPGSPDYGSSDKKNPMEAMMPMIMMGQMMSGGMGNMFGGTTPSADGVVDPMAAMMPMMMMSMFSGGDMGEGMESMMPMMMMSQMMKSLAPEPVKEKRSHKKKPEQEVVPTATNSNTEDVDY